ncbi:MAG: hypothetical protein ACTSRA_22310, partial [Promethearchaeota archaeon]
MSCSITIHMPQALLDQLIEYRGLMDSLNGLSEITGVLIGVDARDLDISTDDGSGLIIACGAYLFDRFDNKLMRLCSLSESLMEGVKPTIRAKLAPSKLKFIATLSLHAKDNPLFENTKNFLDEMSGLGMLRSIRLEISDPNDEISIFSQNCKESVVDFEIDKDLLELLYRANNQLRSKLFIPMADRGVIITASKKPISEYYEFVPVRTTFAKRRLKVLRINDVLKLVVNILNYFPRAWLKQNLDCTDTEIDDAIKYYREIFNDLEVVKKEDKEIIRVQDLGFSDDLIKNLFK